MLDALNWKKFWMQFNCFRIHQHNRMEQGHIIAKQELSIFHVLVISEWFPCHIKIWLFVQNLVNEDIGTVNSHLKLKKIQLNFFTSQDTSHTERNFTGFQDLKVVYSLWLGFCRSKSLFQITMISQWSKRLR